MARHRADIGTCGERIAHLDLRHAFFHRVDELRVDAFGHDEAARRRAALAGRVEGALHAELDGLRQVGIVEHDLRVLAAHFELHLLLVRHALDADRTTHADRAGEADRVHARVIHQCVADDATAAHHQVEDTGRNARAADDLGQCPGAARHQVGGLQHHAIAEGQGRRDLPGRDRDWEVPRRDEADDADRFARDLHADVRSHRRQQFARQPQAFAREELEDLAGARGLADAFGLGLAFFASEQRAEFFLARKNLGADLVERIGAGLDAAGGPGREGGGSGCHSGFDMRSVALRVLGDGVAEVRRVQVRAVAAALGPLAADEVVVLLHVLAFRGLAGRACR